MVVISVTAQPKSMDLCVVTCHGTVKDEENVCNKNTALLRDKITNI